MLADMVNRWRQWRRNRLLRRLAEELLDAGWDPARPETIHAVIDHVRQRAWEDGRSIREAEEHIALLRELAQKSTPDQPAGE